MATAMRPVPSIVIKKKINSKPSATIEVKKSLTLVRNNVNTRQKMLEFYAEMVVEKNISVNCILCNESMVIHALNNLNFL